MSYERKRDKLIMLSSNMITWAYITLIIAYWNHCIFFPVFFFTPPLFQVFSDERIVNSEQRINLKFLVRLGNTPL